MRPICEIPLGVQIKTHVNNVDIYYTSIYIYLYIYIYQSIGLCQIAGVITLRVIYILPVMYALFGVFLFKKKYFNKNPLFSYHNNNKKVNFTVQSILFGRFIIEIARMFGLLVEVDLFMVVLSLIILLLLLLPVVVTFADGGDWWRRLTLELELCWW